MENKIFVLKMTELLSMIFMIFGVFLQISKFLSLSYLVGLVVWVFGVLIWFYKEEMAGIKNG